MANQNGAGRQEFPNGATVDIKYFDDGTATYAVTPGPQSQGAPMPPGWPAAYPGATVNQAPA